MNRHGNSRPVRRLIFLGVGFPDRVVFAPPRTSRAVTTSTRGAGAARSSAGCCDRLTRGKMIDKGVELLSQIARLLEGRLTDLQLLLVGGNPPILECTRRCVADLRFEADSVILARFVSPANVDVNLAAAGVLLQHQARLSLIFGYTTPGKAYDYVSASRPIVATSTPLFDEVFGGDGVSAVRVEDEPHTFAEEIERLSEHGRKMAERGAAYVASLLWGRRVDSVPEGLRS